MKKHIISIFNWKAVALMVFGASTTPQLHAQTLPVSDTAFHLVSITAIAADSTPRSTSSYIYVAPKNELMRWPNYPLTAQQIEERDRKNKQKSFGGDIIDEKIQSLVNRKKKTTVKQPAGF